MRLDYKFSKKGTIITIIIAVLFVLVAVGGVYLYTHHIGSVAEAENFFIESRRAVFIQQDGQLNELKTYLQESGELKVPIASITLSHATATTGGYTVNAYGKWKINCSGKIYAYTFFISKLGNITKQDEVLIWEGQKCLDD